MAITPVDVVEGITEAIPGFFNDAFDQFRQGEGGYLANGMPEGPIAQIGQAVGRAACRRYGTGTLDLSGRQARRYERACRPYLDTLEPSGGIQFREPYKGGQCATGYIVSSERIQEGQPNVVLQKRAFLGPLGATRVTSSGGSQSTFSIFAQGRLSLIGGTNCGAVTEAGAAFYEIASAVSTNPEVKFSWTITSVVACGAGPNNCGNPPPQVFPPDPIEDPTPPPFQFNPGPDIDVPINIEVNPDGTINVDFGGDPVTVDPFPAEDEPGGGGPGGGSPPVAGEPGASVETGPGGAGQGGESEGEAPEGKVLTGVRIDILTAPDSRSRFTLEVNRGVAYIYMGTPIEGLGLEPTGAMVRDGQFFFAQKDYLTSWAVRAKPGYNLRTTPYYRDAVE